jgi:hypothetical protein
VLDGKLTKIHCAEYTQPSEVLEAALGFSMTNSLQDENTELTVKINARPP